MKTSTKAGWLAGGVIGLAMASAAPVHATPDPTNDPVQYQAACETLVQKFNGDLDNDGPTLMGVIRAIRDYNPGMEMVDGARVVTRMVILHCPSVEPQLVAVGKMWAAGLGGFTGAPHPTLQKAS